MNPAVLWTTLLLAGAVWLWMPSIQAARLLPARPGRLPDWLTGPPGAVPLSRRLAVGAAVGLAAVLILPGALGLVVGPAAALGLVVATARLEPRAIRRQREQLAEQFADAVELLAAVVQSGSPLRLAVAEVARVVPDASAELLGLIGAHTQVGASDATAWRSLPEGPARQVWGQLGDDLALAVESGLGMSELLGRHAADARRRQAVSAQRRARTVAVRSVMPLMCCFLPAFVLLGVVPIVLGTIDRVLG